MIIRVISQPQSPNTWTPKTLSRDNQANSGENDRQRRDLRQEIEKMARQRPGSTVLFKETGKLPETGRLSGGVRSLVRTSLRLIIP